MAAIQKICLPFFSRLDKLVWIKDPKGQFSIKSTYNTCQETSISHSQNPFWKKYWKLKVYDRVKMLLWRIASNVLPTKDNLAKKLGITDTDCPLCNEANEIVTHLFFDMFFISLYIYIFKANRLRFLNNSHHLCFDLPSINATYATLFGDCAKSI